MHALIEPTRKDLHIYLHARIPYNRQHVFDLQINLHARVRIDPEGLKAATRGSSKDLPYRGCE